MDGYMDDISKEEQKGQRQEIKEMLKTKLLDAMKDSTVSMEDIFNELRKGLNPKDQALVDKLLTEGMTMEEIVDKFLKGDMDEYTASEKQQKKDETKKKIKDLVNNSDLRADEIFEILKSELDKRDQEIMNEMLIKGYTKEEIVKYFMKGGLDEGKEEQQKIKEKSKQDIELLLADKNNNPDDIFDLLKKKLS